MLFDLDGTLVDSLADIAATANYLRGEFGLGAQPIDVARSWIGDGAMVLLQRCLAELGPFEPLRERAWQLYVEHHLEQCIAQVQPYPGVLDQLAAWRAAGRPLALVTNKPRLFAERILDHLGLAPLLDACVFGDTLPQRKPDPAPLREALRLLGFAADRPPPAAATMVGDGVQDLRAGKAAGLRTAAVLFGFHPEERLRAEGADEYWRAFGVPAT